MPAAPSSKWALPQPADADFINTWPAQTRALVAALDPLIAAVSVAAVRPAAGKPGLIHIASTGTISLDLGTAWVELARHPHAARHAEGGDDPIVGVVPIATIVPYGGTALPSGGAWAWADGGLINRTIYGTFYGRVGDAYNGGASPGSGTPTQGDPTVGTLVRLPDKRGRVSMGANNFGAGTAGTGNARGQAARGANGGEVLHTLSVNEMPAHNHGLQMFLMNYTAVRPYPISGESSGFGGYAYTDNAGSGTPHQNLPPYEVDNYIVRIA